MSAEAITQDQLSKIYDLCDKLHTPHMCACKKLKANPCNTLIKALTEANWDVDLAFYVEMERLATTRMDENWAKSHMSDS